MALAALFTAGALLPRPILAQDDEEDATEQNLTLEDLALAAEQAGPAPQVQQDLTGDAFKGRALPALYDYFEKQLGPREQTPIALWYRNNFEDFREAVARLSARGGEIAMDELAEETFSSFLGETSWTAERNRAAVLQALNWLREQRQRADVPRDVKARYASLEKALVLEIAEDGDNDELRAEANRGPRDVPWTERAFRARGVDLYDFSRAAALLMSWIEERDRLLAQGSLAEILQSPPNPASELPDPGHVTSWLSRAESVVGSDAIKGEYLADARTYLVAMNSSRQAHTEAVQGLADLLGAKPSDRTDLRRLSRRYLRQHRDDRAAGKRLEEALRNLDHANREGQDALAGFRTAMAAAAPPGSLPAPGSSADQAAMTTAGGLFDPLDASSIPSRIRREILKSDFRTSLKLLDLDIAEGIGVSARYRWEIDGNLEDKYWTRVDTWELQGNVSIGDIIREWVDLPIGFGISAGRKLIMARQFKSMKKAALALPRTPLNIPINARKARDLNVGDFFSIPAEMSLASHIGFGYSPVAVVNAGASASYVINGRFRIQVFKTDEHHVRLRLIGLRSQGPSVSGRVGLSIEIFGIRFLDRLIGKAIGVNPVRLGGDRRKGVTFTVDYVFDLRDEHASNAYDTIMNASLKTGEILAANAVIREKGLQKTMLSDLRPAEDLFHQDVTLPPSSRRVNRLFKGSNRYSSRGRNFRLGIKLLQFDRRSSWVENLLKVYDEQDEVSTYLFPVYTRASRFSLLFGLIKSDREHKAFALVPLDDQGKTTSIQEVVFAATERFKKADAGDVRQARIEIENAIGPNLASRLYLEDFPHGGSKRFNVDYSVAFHKEAVERLLDPEQTTEDDIWEAIARITPVFDIYRDNSNDDDSFGRPDRPFAYHNWSRAKRDAFDAVVKEWGDYWNSTSNLVEDLLALQRIEGKPEDRAREFLQLASESLFREIGIRLLIEIVGTDHVDRDLFVDVAASAHGRPRYEGHAGRDTFRELYALVNEALYNVGDRDR